MSPGERTRPTAPIDPGVTVGHVHLKVADLERALDFWHRALGLEVTARAPGAVFLAAGGYHHHVALNTWTSLGGSPPPRGSTGLFHVALRHPTRRSLARAIARVRAAGHPIRGAADHGTSEAVYLADPDGNGVELYRDRPSEEWPRSEDGQIVFTTERLDLMGLLGEGGG